MKVSLVAGFTSLSLSLKDIPSKASFCKSTISRALRVIFKKIYSFQKFGNLLKHSIFAASQSIHNFLKNDSL
jgi:hypothetical protein